ncbi:hypothetical protein EDB80DRAFT_818189 [Ilyonectria destructans]|nr:hypothetical protein EDB80DRAFT_818189 [Ilyonectria destructans]
MIKKNHLELEEAGIYSGTIYPAAYNSVINITATDQYSCITPVSANSVDILIPGQDIVTEGPSYIDKYITSSVSGSSVATATAAGIALLVLLLLRTFNWNQPPEKTTAAKQRSFGAQQQRHRLTPEDQERADEAQIKTFYTRDGILGVFDRMNAHNAGA